MRGEIMKGEVCFKSMSQNPPLYTTFGIWQDYGEYKESGRC